MADDVVMDGEVNRRDEGLAEMEEARDKGLTDGVEMRRMMEGMHEPRRIADWGQVGREYGVNSGLQSTAEFREGSGRGERGRGLRRGGGVLAGDSGGLHGGGVGGLEGADVGSVGRGGNRGRMGTVQHGRGDGGSTRQQGVVGGCGRVDG
ncbi:PREDICTED: glycine-rich protein DOT1-like [Ipomoea nil]|uniref:glycine-rich protein DOT1-like n=1 Tax=Ipomoea nil TaxID=35883 RepID=UPI000901B420|nr:PREDICTED: glycine-rich protein DOT1-like [Ipomoea nil]